jgi:hypothetical protein
MTKASAEKLVQYLKDHPTELYSEVAATIGCSVPTISRLAHAHGLVRGRKRISDADLAKLTDTGPQQKDGREWQN